MKPVMIDIFELNNSIESSELKTNDLSDIKLRDEYNKKMGRQHIGAEVYIRDNLSYINHLVMPEGGLVDKYTHLDQFLT